MTDSVRVWLVERTFSDDEQNLVILVYATPDGERYLRKERALTSYSDDRETHVSLAVEPGDLADVADPATRRRYADAASELRDTRSPDDTL